MEEDVIRQRITSAYNDTQYPKFTALHRSLELSDGWLIGPNDELVLWVPAAYQEGLWGPGCRMLNVPHTTEIDFKHFKCGEEWTQCRDPLPEPGV